jgi:hypothetical protein
METKPLHSLHFDATRVEIFDDSTRITLDDGSIIHGMPEDTDSYRATALYHGYDTDTTTLCIEHELMHVALAYWLQSVSPTLEFVGKGTEADVDLRILEEDAVFSIQRYARAAKIDIVKLFGSN